MTERSDIKEKTMTRIRIMDMPGRKHRWLRFVLIAAPVGGILIALMSLYFLGIFPQPDNVIAMASAAANEVKSYHFSNTMQSLYTSTGVIYTETMEGDFNLPDLWQAKITLDHNYGNNWTTLEEVIAGGNLYTRYDNQVNWIVQPQPKSMTPPHPSDVFSSLKGFQKLPDEEINGVLCLHYHKVAETNIINSYAQRDPVLAHELKTGSKITEDVWFSKDDLLPRRILITPVYSKDPVQVWGKDATVAMSYMTNFRYDQPVRIEPPVKK